MATKKVKPKAPAKGTTSKSGRAAATRVTKRKSQRQLARKSQRQLARKSLRQL
ncbi:MAG TPA: hypothetical protein VGS09_02840 [Actinomycetota bacterium]|jgi:hypothetical protein|nr:hypothetical protein [Actinomycetota bacterium]